MKKGNIKLFILFFGLMFLAALTASLGNDYFWHVKAGEYMVKNLTIPYVDVFSWYGIQKSLYWISHEWLSEVVIYTFKFLFGNAAPYVFCGVVHALIIGFLYIFNQKSLQKNTLFTILWSSIGFMVFSKVMLPRPHMISFLLLVFTVYLLYDNYYNKKSNKIFFLPLVSVLWANFHGGSSNLPYILCLIFIVGNLFNFKIGRLVSERIEIKQLLKYIAVFVLCALAVNINPHGFKMFMYPYENMQDSFMLKTILEWAPPSLSDFGDLSAFALLGVVALVMMLSIKKIKFIDLALLGAFVFLGLKSSKFIPLLYIVSTFIVPNYMERKEEEFTKGAMWIFGSTILLLGGLIVCLTMPRRDKMIPDEIISYIKEKNPERLYNHYNYGGYLIYNDIKVFIDGRADMYSKHNFRDAIDLATYGYDYILNSYDFDMFVFMEGINLQTELNKNPNYIITKSVDGVAVYEKKVTE